MKINYKSWDDISISKFEQIKKVVDDEELSAAEKDIKLIAMMCDVDEKEIWALTVGEIHQLSTQLNWIESTSFTHPNEPRYKSVKIGGYDIRVETDLRKMTIAQYVDFQTYYQDVDRYRAELLSVFFIPKGKKYGEGYDIVDFIQTIRDNVSIIDFNTFLFFFVRKSEHSMKDTAICLASKLKVKAWMMRDSPMKAEYKKMAKILKEVGFNGFS